MPDDKPTPESPKREAMPRSLDGHVVPPERLAAIGEHMAVLSATALAVNDTLPLQADAGDFAAEMDKEAE